jgi:hypothetical protein
MSSSLTGKVIFQNVSESGKSSHKTEGMLFQSVWLSQNWEMPRVLKGWKQTVEPASNAPWGTQHTHGTIACYGYVLYVCYKLIDI